MASSRCGRTLIYCGRRREAHRRLKLYEYAIRRLLLMVLVLVGLSLLIFYLTRGLLPPTSALAPYISPRMDSQQKLALAQSLNVATASCASFDAFSGGHSGCVVPLWQQYFGWLKPVLSGNWGYTLLPGIAGTESTWSVFASRFPYTAELAIVGSLFTIVIGIPFG